MTRRKHILFSSYIQISESKSFSSFTTSIRHLSKINLPTFHNDILDLLRNPSDTERDFEQVSKTQDYGFDGIQSVAVQLPDGIKKENGIVFTPTWLSDFTTKEAFRLWNTLHRTGKHPQIVADFSCGIGSFLMALNNQRSADTTIVGIDSNPEFCDIAKIVSHFGNYKWAISCGDSLDHKICLGIGGPAGATLKADIIVGNPPFVSSQNLRTQYAKELRNNFRSIDSGHFDLSICFIEKSLSYLAPGGVASLILSNKFMTSKYGRAICKFLAEKCRVVDIKDFHDSQLFEDVTTYTCILTIANLTSAKKFTLTQYPGGFSRSGSVEQVSSIDHTILESHPWKITSGDIASIISAMSAASNPGVLDIFGDLFQGFRTGANDVFVLKSKEASILGIEKDILRSFVGGEQISRLGISDDGLKVIFPYEKDALGKHVLISAERMKTLYPKAWQYLNNNKPHLIERTIDGSTQWYGFSRGQNLRLAEVPKLLIKEMMPRAEFAFDAKGGYVFSSGYALDASKLNREQLTMWAAILNTPTLEFLMRQMSTQLHSGWFRFLKHYFLRIRLPKLSVAVTKKLVRLAEALVENPDDSQKWNVVDALVADCYGLSQSQRELMFSYLAEFHKRSLPTRSLQRQAVPQKPSRYEPVKLAEFDSLHRDRHDLQRLVTFSQNKKLAVHRWYQYTQGFSGPLVTAFLEEYSFKSPAVILDPFSGCGTTGVVCRSRGLHSIGVDLSPFASFIAAMKTKPISSNDIETIRRYFTSCEILVDRSRPNLFADFLEKAFSPYILDQVICYLDGLHSSKLSVVQQNWARFVVVAILEEVSQIRKHGSHYRYMLKESSVGLQKLNIKIISEKEKILPFILKKLEQIEVDSKSSLPTTNGLARIEVGDATNLSLKSASVDGIITSPPYLNRNNYIAQQKAEISLLGLLSEYGQYRTLVRSTFKSHIESDLKQEYMSSLQEVKTIVERCSETDLNNPKIPLMIQGYFYDLEKTMIEIARVAKKRAPIWVVVGNTRWGGIVVPVDHLLAKIGQNNGLTAEKILVTRMKGNSPQQMSRYGRIAVRESIVVFRKK